MGKNRIDWDSVEPLYRAGALSNCEICRQYAADHKNSQTWKSSVAESAIRKHAKAKGWKKDLADKVKKQIKENLVREEVRSSHSGDLLTDQQIIDHAAAAGSSIVMRHRQEIHELLAIEKKFLIELSGEPTKLHFASYQGDITSKSVELTISEKASTLKNLAEVRGKRIALEREAFSLNDPDTDEVTRKQMALNEVMMMLPIEVREKIREKAVEKAGGINA